MNEPAAKTHWWMNLLNRPGWLVLLAVCLVLTAITLPFGWHYYRTRQLTAGLEARGGMIRFETNGPKWLREVVGDRMLEPFNDAPTALFSDGVDDDSLQNYLVPLNDLHGLQGLFILSSKVELSKENYHELSRFSDLKHLAISSPNFDDEAFSFVSSLQNLRALTLDGTSVGNEGLRHLHRLKNLKYISLSNTNVTDEGVSELQRRLPDADISDD